MTKLDFFKNAYKLIDGKKTFIVALAGLVYGIGTGDVEIILACLVALGFRDAMNK